MVHSECLESNYIASRPFRVNAVSIFTLTVAIIRTSHGHSGLIEAHSNFIFKLTIINAHEDGNSCLGVFFSLPFIPPSNILGEKLSFQDCMQINHSPFFKLLIALAIIEFRNFYVLLKACFFYIPLK